MWLMMRSVRRSYLLLVVQALVVVVKDGRAFRLSGVVVGGGVGDVAGEDFLPEREAAGGPCAVSVSFLTVL